MVGVRIPFNAVAQRPQFHRRCGAESDFCFRSKKIDQSLMLPRLSLDFSCIFSILSHLR